MMKAVLINETEEKKDGNGVWCEVSAAEQTNKGRGRVWNGVFDNWLLSYMASVAKIRT